MWTHRQQLPHQRKQAKWILHVAFCKIDADVKVMDKQRKRTHDPFSNAKGDVGRDFLNFFPSLLFPSFKHSFLVFGIIIITMAETKKKI